MSLTMSQTSSISSPTFVTSVQALVWISKVSPVWLKAISTVKPKRRTQMTLKPILEKAVAKKIKNEEIKTAKNDAPLEFYKRRLEWERSWRRKKKTPRPRPGDSRPGQTGKDKEQ